MWFPITVISLLGVIVILQIVALLLRRDARVLGALDSAEKTTRDEFAQNREEGGVANRQMREELTASVQRFGDSFVARMAEIAQLQQNHLDGFSHQIGGRIGDFAAFQQAQLEGFTRNLNALSQGNEQRLAAMRDTIERKLAEIQADNTQKLEQMRATVDEKLHATLEQRLGDSFKIVSERLEMVHNGLGEMRNLATGVGDLKKVLSNIKTRGGWGEVQLGNLLEQMLAPEQFARNVAPRSDSDERVEFAVKLPGREADGSPVWLPIDAKFPQEEFQRLVDAQERGDAAAAENASVALENSVKLEARKISTKYISPPQTTDFAILFLPTEGLFAEVLRRPGLADGLQRNFRVVVAGPTTLAALLSSLQMGFRTLAIEKRSSEVWTVLGAVKTEFGKFGDALEKVQKKLQEATNSIDDASRRSRAVQRKLNTADEIPTSDAQTLLGFEVEGE
ncbi:MAG TPA: DNA recombination protein RmuC [Chthoniobacterales bacterium]